MNIAFIPNHGTWFPDPLEIAGDPRYPGLVTVGGTLEPNRVLQAYRQGLFPWIECPEITWWSPDPRGIFEMDRFHVSTSFRRTLKRNPFRISTNAAFSRVIRGCAAPAPGRETTWITPGFIEAYETLHHLGHAHSVECWQGDTLAGGVYGVAIGGLFAAESMFHVVSEASKVALYELLQHLRGRRFILFDVQMLTPITRQMGGVEIPRTEYLRRLRDAVNHPASFK